MAYTLEEKSAKAAPQQSKKDKIAAEQVVFDIDDVPITPESNDAFRCRSLNIVTIKDKWDAQSRTLDISNFEDEEALDNVEEAIEVTEKMANVRYTFKKEDLYAFLYTKISAIAKYYAKKGDGLSFAFRPLTAVGKEYWSDHLYRDESRVGPLLRGYQIITINLNTNLGKMYKHAMNFLNYWKSAEDENVEFKKKITLLENTISNTGSRRNTSVEDDSESKFLRHENAALREKVHDLQEEVQLGLAKLNAAIGRRAREENENLEAGDSRPDPRDPYDDRSPSPDRGRSRSQSPSSSNGYYNCPRLLAELNEVKEELDNTKDSLIVAEELGTEVAIKEGEITDLNALLDYLKNEYYDYNRKEKAIFEFNELVFKMNQDFQDFCNSFVRLAEFNWKFPTDIQNALLFGYSEDTVNFPTFVRMAKKCSKQKEKGKENNGNKTSSSSSNTFGKAKGSSNSSLSAAKGSGGGFRRPPEISKEEIRKLLEEDKCFTGYRFRDCPNKRSSTNRINELFARKAEKEDSEKSFKAKN
ncbi:LOW QUALITY PROTEIN: hypothetical protein QBC45DRAFT_412987 [Copromyces sp. CBS 386.78]|nr:LOW QUALITY PROTEIN: hypothetical protein QBC45DRAFT_412987 [Copromyces sp. CBS 386.78]